MKTLRDINLNALRIAESAARTGSFVRAAEEQHLTPSAVSHRIKALESQLRFQLFVRSKNSVTLTPEGQDFIGQVREGLRTIVAAKKSVGGRKSALKLWALPTFTMRWLLPRLPDFRMRWPEIQLSISTSYDWPDLATELVDVAIYYGDGNFPQMQSRALFQEDLIPVCSPVLPAMIGKRGKDLCIEDLQQLTLLHSDTCTPNWKSWLTFAKAPEIIETAKSIHFDSCMLTYDAAVAGLGFACANRAYVASDIAAGRLISPFRLKHPNRNGWHLLFPEHRAPSRQAAAFKDWIVGQVELSGLATRGAKSVGRQSRATGGRERIRQNVL